jgi:hypothetical protein
MIRKKVVFIEFLPKLLFMKRPDPDAGKKGRKKRNKSVREYKYTGGSAAATNDDGESGSAQAASAQAASLLARNLSLDLNENLATSNVVLGLKSKDTCGATQAASSKLVDSFGATMSNKPKLNRQSSFNRSTLDNQLSNFEGKFTFILIPLLLNIRFN